SLSTLYDPLLHHQLSCNALPRPLRSFPTRRSSDLTCGPALNSLVTMSKSPSPSRSSRTAERLARAAIIVSFPAASNRHPASTPPGSLHAAQKNCPRSAPLQSRVNQT